MSVNSKMIVSVTPLIVSQASDDSIKKLARPRERFARSRYPRRSVSLRNPSLIHLYTSQLNRPSTCSLT